MKSQHSTASPEEAAIASTGNVFADIGVANAGDREYKATLVRAFRAAYERQGLTQVAAAEKTGLTQSDLSKVLRGIVSGVSTERLIRALNGLGQDIKVSVSPARDESNVVGRTRVLADVA